MSLIGREDSLSAQSHPLEQTVRELSELSRHLRELADVGDRELVIIAAAAIETELGRLLEASFVELPRRRHKEIFEGTGPLATFFSRNAIAHASALIDDELSADIELIRRIRNVFAHSFVPASLAGDGIRDQVRALRFVDLESVRAKLERNGLETTVDGIYYILGKEVSVALTDADRGAIAWFHRLEEDLGNERNRFLNAVRLIWYQLAAARFLKLLDRRARAAG